MPSPSQQISSMGPTFQVFEGLPSSKKHAPCGFSPQRNAKKQNVKSIGTTPKKPCRNYHPQSQHCSHHQVDMTPFLGKIPGSLNRLLPPQASPSIHPVAYLEDPRYSWYQKVIHPIASVRPLYIWWFQPIWKIFVKLDHFPRLGWK